MPAGSAGVGSSSGSATDYSWRLRRSRCETGGLSSAGLELESVEAWRDGIGFVDDIEPGEIVTVHWSWACDRLSARQLAGLRYWTRRQLDIANLTI